MNKKEIICIVCPIGCRLNVTKDDSNSLGYSVTGHACKRGIEYGIKELSNPTRIITSTVKINNAPLKRIPVKTNGPIPKNLNFDCMKIINSVEIEAPIKVGEIIVKNILKTGVDLVVTRSM